MNTKGKIIRIITELSYELGLDINGFSNDLSKLGLDSINFIQIVVSIEEEFQIEFEDEFLDYSRYLLLEDLCEYVERQLKLPVTNKTSHPNDR